MCVNCETDFYRNAASRYNNQKAHKFCKEITFKGTGGDWYPSEIRKAKKVARKTENVHKYGNDYYKTQFHIAKQANFKLVTAAKCNCYRSKIEERTNYSSKLYGLLNRLLDKLNGYNHLQI